MDDEADIRNLICECLQDEKFETRAASSDLEALSMLDDKVPTIVILDVWLQGSELAQHIRTVTIQANMPHVRVTF